MAEKNVVEQIKELLNSLSEDSQKAAIKKCEENSFDPDKGIISLEESFQNLNHAKAVFSDLIAKDKFAQIPLSIQQGTIEPLKTVRRFLTELVNGTDQVKNLVNSIEELNTLVWRNGFDNLTDEIAGYETKMNQLKHLERELAALKSDIEKGIVLKTELEELVGLAKHRAEDAEKNAKLAVDAKDQAETALEKVDEVRIQTTTVAATTDEERGKISSFLKDSETRNEKIVALETSINEFHQTIEDKKRDFEKFLTTSTTAINTLKTNSESVVEKHNKDTDALMKRLLKLEDQIKDQLTKATGYSLFQSFQVRQQSLGRNKYFWLVAVALLLIAAIGVAAWIADSHGSGTLVLVLKALTAIPLGYSIWFCSSQFSKERKLEEEYAFKSNISVSLVPYKELVEKSLNPDAADKQKYTEFLIASISKVFESPTDKIFHRREKAVLMDKKSTEAMCSLIEAVKGVTTK